MSEQRGAAAAAETITEIFERVESAAIIDRSILEDITAAILARGHVLLEDVPGTGKTVTARVLAEALGLSFTRIQFTPDLLPSDVTGSNIYNEHEGTFEFSEGPVFTNVVLADEINRAPPKTQAALLEAMEERQVSVDGTTHPLPEPFVVIATQNPVEQEGTFRLPEAQRDRVAVKTSFGYPGDEGEMDLLDRRANRRSLSPTVDPVVDEATVTDLQDRTEDVTVEKRVRRYIIDVARATRTDGRTEVGVSPRGVQRVFEAARARALIDGREFVTPEDVKRLAPATMAHRLVLTTEATVEGLDPRAVVDSALSRVDVPAVSPNAGDADDTAPPTGGDSRHRQPGASQQGHSAADGRHQSGAGAPQGGREASGTNQQPPGDGTGTNGRGPGGQQPPEENRDGPQQGGPGREESDSHRQGEEKPDWPPGADDEEDEDEDGWLPGEQS